MKIELELTDKQVSTLVEQAITNIINNKIIEEWNNLFYHSTAFRSVVFECIDKNTKSRIDDIVFDKDIKSKIEKMDVGEYVADKFMSIFASQLDESACEYKD